MARIMTVRPPEDLHLKLKSIANNLGIPLNSLILMILSEWLKEEKREKQ